MAYQHLTQKERYQIYAYRKAGFSKSHIAAEIGRSPSTIGRELRRNRGRRGYRPIFTSKCAIKEQQLLSVICRRGYSCRRGRSADRAYHSLRKDDDNNDIWLA